MQVKQVDGGSLGKGGGEPRLWVAVLDSGEEVKATLVDFAKRENVKAASFVALGAFKRATIAYFDFVQKKYKPIPIEEQVEVVALAGDVVRDEKDEPDLHAHTVLGLPDGSTRGGHLLEGQVRPTLEVTITETPGHLVRRKRPELGIALIDLG
jgi:predicted DNA-binding protein with PD1-like motif